MDKINIGITGDGNKIIHKFLGKKWIAVKYGFSSIGYHSSGGGFLSEKAAQKYCNRINKGALLRESYFAMPAPLGMNFNLPYHLSWDALIPAIRKFDRLYEKVDFEELYDSYKTLCDQIDKRVTCYDILPVWEKMVLAINWYNDLKK